MSSAEIRRSRGLESKSKLINLNPIWSDSSHFPDLVSIPSVGSIMRLVAWPRRDGQGAAGGGMGGGGAVRDCHMAPFVGA